MATQNKNTAGTGVEIDINADGVSIIGGTIARLLKWLGSDITITGSGANTYTFPASTSTLASLTLTETFTGKTISDASNTIILTPKMVASDDFSNSGRQQQAVTGGGGTAFSNDGIGISTGGNGSSLTRWGPSGVLGTTNLEGGNPIFSATGYLNALGTDEDMFSGMGQPTVATAAITFTGKHIGFKVVRTASGANSLFATQADGTTENASAALTTIAVNDVIDLIVKVNGTASADYYWRKNGGALSAATNLTSNLPTGLTQCTVAVSSHNVSTNTEWNWGAWSYSR